MEKEDNEDMTQNIREEQEQFIHYLNELENIGSVYDIEDMGNESPEQEYIMYIEDHCREIRELINKLYNTKLYIINNVKNTDIVFYRDKMEFELLKGL